MKGRSTPKVFRGVTLFDRDSEAWTYLRRSDTWHVDTDDGVPAVAGFSFQRLVDRFGPLTHANGNAATL